MSFLNIFNFIFLILLSTFINKSDTNDELNNKDYPKDECANNIYRKCIYSQQYTDKDVENVRKFLQNKFITEAAVKPIKPPCQKLILRKEWKCMREDERLEVIKIIRQLYKKGDIEFLSNVHQNWWAAWHKSPELATAHKIFGMMLERKIREINPKLYLPMWYNEIDFAQPERSLLWDYFGRSGNYSTSYCVPEGMYENLSTVKCTRREWNDDCTIVPWYGPEIQTSYLQNSAYVRLAVLGFHFLPHLAMGGWYGDYSITTAPNDVTFFFWHDLSLRTQIRSALRDPSYLTPLSYNTQLRANPLTGKIEPANLSDRSSYYSQYSIAEVFQTTFGDFCFIPEEMVVIISKLIKNETFPVPTAVKRLRKALPKDLLLKYFPEFAAGNYNPLYHFMLETGNCNTDCKPIPMFQLYNETENGRRQNVLLKYELNYDINPFVQTAQQFYVDMILDLNKHGYCSPYIA